MTKEAEVAGELLAPCRFCSSPTPQIIERADEWYGCCYRKGCNVEVLLADCNSREEATAKWNSRAARPADEVAEERLSELETQLSWTVAIKDAEIEELKRQLSERPDDDRIIALAKHWVGWLTGDPYDADEIDTADKAFQVIEGCLKAAEKLNNEVKRGQNKT